MRIRLNPKKHGPLALSLLALALAAWWAWTNVRDAVDADTQAAARAPSPWPDFDRLPQEPEPVPVTEEPAQPVLQSRPPPPAPPPERVVPEVAPPGEAADSPRPERPEEPQGPPAGTGRPQDLLGTSHKSDLLGGVARTNARATPEVEVPDGFAWIGTPWRWVQGTAEAVGAGTFPGLLMEAPRFRVRMDRFFIDRFEVSNFQYWVYLDRTARVTIRTERAGRGTLADLARQVIRAPPRNLDYDVVARQIYEANRGVLRSALQGSVVVDRNGNVDDEATWQRIRERELPGGLQLAFYDRAPPATWPSDRFAEREVDHPVRGVSANEAIAYALQRGRHVPTELEWEYAARGPSGLDFPWDPQGREFASHVNGGEPLPRGVQPRTVPVTHFGQGASWIGVFQMLGNVSEWTSSYLDPYPGGIAEAGIRPGEHVVVRGGSANDRERVPVRPAFRGWTGGAAEQGPQPDVRRPWTGFRTARYVEVARSRIPTMHFRARRAGLLDPAALEPLQYAGEQGVLETAVFLDGPGEPSVRPGVKAFVAQPLRALALRPRGEAVFRADTDHGLLSRDDVLVRTAVDGPVFLGLFHNDLELVDTWVPEPQAGADPLRAPVRVQVARCPPGTWFVAIVHRTLALVAPDLGRVHYVHRPTRDVPATLFNVIEAERPYTSVWVRVVPGGGRVDVRLGVPMGGGAAARLLAIVRLQLAVDPRHSRTVKNWRPGRMR